MFPKNQGKYYIKTTLGWYSIHYYDMEHQVLSWNHRVTSRVQQLLCGGYTGNVLLRPSASCCIDHKDIITVGILSWGLVRTMLFKLTEIIASAKVQVVITQNDSSVFSCAQVPLTCPVWPHMTRTLQALFPLHDMSWLNSLLAPGMLSLSLYCINCISLVCIFFACNAPQQHGKFTFMWKCENRADTMAGCHFYWYSILPGTDAISL